MGKNKNKRIFRAMMLSLMLLLIVPSVVNMSGQTITAQAASIKISKKKATLIKGQTLKLKISGTSSKVKWSSNKKSVATVSSSGKVTAKKKGTATITAKVGSKKYTCKITVETPKISKSSVTLAKGKATTLKVNGTSQTVKWSSSKKSVATVSSKGKITAKKTGTATITAKVGSKKYTCKVTVQNPTISQTTLSLEVGTNKTLSVSGTSKTVTWVSSNSSVAAVNSSGKVTALKAGTATITATVLGKNLTCTVTVTKPLTVSASTLYSGNDTIVKTTGTVTETTSAYKIGLYYENNSDINLDYCIHAYAVNGIMSDESYYVSSTDVAAGKKASNVLTISKTWLEECGIEEIKYIDILFWAYNNDTNYKSFESEIVRIKTDAYNDSSDYTHKTQVYNKNGVVVEYISATINTFTFAVYNNSSMYFNFDLENFSVNDWTYNVGIQVYNEEVFPGCARICTVSLSSDFLTSSSISSIDSVEFTLNVRPLGSYYDDFDTDVIVAK